MNFEKLEHSAITKLKNLVQIKQMEKTVYLDFDGIFSSTMLYDANQKFAKSAQLSARYAIEMLKYFGFKVYVITGDASGNGSAIARKILERIPIDDFITVAGTSKHSLISEREDAGKVFYCGDDLFDASMTDMVLFTTNNAHMFIKSNADYVSNSTSYDYCVMDFALMLCYSFGIEPLLYTNKIKNNIKLDMVDGYNVNKMNNVLVSHSDAYLHDVIQPAILNNYHFDIIAASTQTVPYFGNSGLSLKDSAIICFTSLTHFNTLGLVEHDPVSNCNIYIYLDDAETRTTSLKEFVKLNEFINKVKHKLDIKLLVKALDADTLLTLHNNMLFNKLYNVCAAMDVFYDSVKEPEIVS